MKIWFDADNGPHVLIMRPLADALAARGHDVFFTARDRTNTCELLDLYGFEYLRVGGLYGNGMLGKIGGTLRRAWALAGTARRRRPDVSFGHGSRALPIASRLLRVPSLTMYDYEWVDPRIFNWGCKKILLPEAIGEERRREAGISAPKAVAFPGYKEILYLGGKELDTSVAQSLGLREGSTHVLLRPPATTAHYHNAESEVLLAAILKKLAAADDVQLVFLPRTEDQHGLPTAAGMDNVIIPDRVYDGPSLIAAMDLVISGGGTMTREAAIMGVPSFSFFRGRSGMVDEDLAERKKLVLLDSVEAVADRLTVERRTGRILLPDPASLVEFIADQIAAASRSQRAK
ncbi:MAG: DUF354 domain-containing protein [bacterium]|nr:DUF354 domain-containing protein [bacterium]